MRNNYITPDNWTCPVCQEPSKIIAADESFSYSGTHCTGGRDGVHVPAGNGRPVCEANGCDVEDAEEYDEPEYRGDY